MDSLFRRGSKILIFYLQLQFSRSFSTEQIRVDEDVHQQLPHFDVNNDGFLDFNEYNDRMMGIINNPETLKQLSEEEQESLRADNQRNTRRFLEADKNQVCFIIFKLFDDKNRMVNLIEKNLVHFC